MSASLSQAATYALTIPSQRVEQAVTYALTIPSQRVEQAVTYALLCPAATLQQAVAYALAKPAATIAQAATYALAKPAAYIRQAVTYALVLDRWLITGTQVPVWLYPESTYATPPTGTTALRATFAAWSVAPSSALRTVNIISSGREPLVVRSPTTLAGTVETAVTAESVGWWLYQTMGRLSTSGSSPYTHVFTVGSLPVGFTAEKEYLNGVSYERQSGLKVASAEFSFSASDMARVSLSLIGARQTLSSTPIGVGVVPGVQTYFVGYNMQISQDGVIVGTVTGISLNIDNGMSNSPLAMLGKPCGLVAGRVGVTSRVQAVFTDLGWLAQALAGTVTNLNVIASVGDGSGSQGNESLVIAMSGCVINPYSPVVNSPYPLVADLLIQVGRLTVTLKNNIPSVLP